MQHLVQQVHHRRNHRLQKMAARTTVGFKLVLLSQVSLSLVYAHIHVVFKFVLNLNTAGVTGPKKSSHIYHECFCVRPVHGGGSNSHSSWTSWGGYQCRPSLQNSAPELSAASAGIEHTNLISNLCRNRWL